MPMIDEQEGRSVFWSCRVRRVLSALLVSYTSGKWASMKRRTTFFVVGTVFLTSFACSGDKFPTEPTTAENPSPRSLRLSTDYETSFRIFVGGQALTTAHGNHSVWLAANNMHYGGNTQTRTITRYATIDQPSVVPCPSGTGSSGCDNIRLFNGFEGESVEPSDGIIWNARQWSIVLTRPSGQNCTYYFSSNHRHANSGNGNFLDHDAGDQQIKISLPSGSGCGSMTWNTGTGLYKHPTPLQPLSFSQGFSGTASAKVGQPFNYTVTAVQGFGNYRFAWNFQGNTGNSVTFPSDFQAGTNGSSDTRTHVYTQPGTYYLRVAIRDGNDNLGHGGHYALNAGITVNVTQ